MSVDSRCPCGRRCRAIRIRYHRHPSSLSDSVRAPIEAFLESFIEEGTVVVPASSYRNADSWTVVTDCRGEILAMGAHRKLPLSMPRTVAVQIVATFLHPRLRGTRFASLLLHGQAFLEARGLRPGKTLYWCGRTRNPAAYAAGMVFNDLRPVLDCPEANRSASALALSLARSAYGEQVEIDPSSFLMRNSYAQSSRFVPLKPSRHHRVSPIARAFFERIDFASNEAIFLMAKVRFFALLPLFVLFCLRLEFAARFARSAWWRSKGVPRPALVKTT